MLAPVDLDEIFENDIAPRLRPRKPQAAVDRRAFCMGGQPGAGKSWAKDKILKEFRLPADSVCYIDADKLRVWHPDYGRLLRTDDREAANETQSAARGWVKRAVEYAVSQGWPIMLDSTLSDPTGAETRFSALKKSEYSVTVVMIGVHDALSRLGALWRYYDQRERKGGGRFVPVGFQERAYPGLLETADWLTGPGSAFVDAVYVGDRLGEITGPLGSHVRARLTMMRDTRWPDMTVGTFARHVSEVRERITRQTGDHMLEDNQELVSILQKLVQSGACVPHH